MTFRSNFHLGCLRANLLCRLAFSVALLMFLSRPTARAYVLEGVHWPANQPIVMGLQLGSPTAALNDGAATWNQVAESALAIWNPYLGSGVQFTYVETAITPAQGDGNNTVFFSTTAFGESFGADTLGLTLYYYNTRTNVTTEADVVFNSAQPFNSYRGPLRVSGRSEVFDLRRIAIHEFGHVLGLDHVAQSAQAIMTPFTTDLDTVQADDIAGVQAIYGVRAVAAVPVITSPLTATGVVGPGGFSYQITATNAPTSFQVTGLPAGFTYDASTGIISGSATLPGTFTLGLNATNAGGTGTATLAVTILPVAQVVPVATATATTPQVTLGSADSGVFTVTLSTAPSADVVVHYTVKGSALNGTDYALLSGSKTIKAGQTNKRIKIVPQGDLGGAAKKTVKLALDPGDGYSVGTATPVKMKIVASGQ